MKTCDQYQAEMLDDLYGLLEAEDSRALSAHVQVCEPCRAAMVQAQEQRKLLAEAAKDAFAGVRFEAPVAPAAAPTQQPAPPRIIASIGPAKPSLQRRLRYAVAAGVVLCAGIAALGAVYWNGRAKFLDKMAQAEAGSDEAAA